MTEVVNVTRVVPQQILTQLGGNMFCAMTGAHAFLIKENALSFLIPRSNNIRKVSIKLEDNDLYTMEFFSIHGNKTKVAAFATNVDCTQLQSMFKKHTGLDTHL